MKIQINRAALMDGEELMDFARSMMKAVFHNASVFGGEPGNVWLAGVFRKTVVVRDEAKDRFVQAIWRRKGEEILFSKPVVVRKAWEVVGSLEGEAEEGNVKREAPEAEELEIYREANGEELERVELDAPGFWGGVIVE